MKKNLRDIFLHVMVLILVITLTILLLYFRKEISHLGVYGYPGIFLISILANATIIIPLPGIFITTAMGAVFNPFGVALAAASGSAIGELTGYLAGFGGQVIIENKKWYTRVMGWMRKYGDVTIFILSLIPNPLFDLAGMAAGTLKMPLWRFLMFCFFGKFLKMLIFAFLGAKLFDTII
jgi:membrane protein YqaA with SNARE-associated domain